MKGTDIINDARAKLKSFIAFEVRNVYLLLNGQEPNFAEDEEYTLDIEGLTVSVEVDNSYLENWSVDYISLSLDGSVYLECSEHGGELELDDLSTDEVAALANVIENQYLQIVKNNTL